MLKIISERIYKILLIMNNFREWARKKFVFLFIVSVVCFLPLSPYILYTHTHMLYWYIIYYIYSAIF